ncbi:MBL fold metallo-hydrolase [Rhodovarius crocodyli]|uniref:MBL fold metallo-hydrolase n=1 Tax=Rhodovarius crocodyli TaxID=1979269 RepID=A0A437MIX5_9PROT|nr:MBL fold metallo-hydrolase [Rhodovarius crocodyli]RVT97581.1 MBL fold metallo-hydrolase [Rhodovarius crocodyli]
MAFKGAIIPVTAFEQNCALLWDDETMEGVVVDPGGDVPRILSTIESQGIKVQRILLTHGHIDHAAGADELRAALKVPVEGPQLADKMLLDNLEKQASAYGFDGARNVTPDRWLEEGDTVRIGAADFAVLHCPGHAPGHVVFVNEDMRFAIVGDVLFQGSIGRTDFPYGDHEALISAIMTKLLPLGDDIQFICGHGPGSTFGKERVSNPFLQE